MSRFELPTTTARSHLIRSALLKKGVSMGGIEQLMSAQPIASPQDRQVVASLIEALLASGVGPGGFFPPSYKPRKPGED